MYKRIKGTLDIWGDDIWYWYKIEKTAREVSMRYGYEEIRTPIIEPTELFVRSVGEETDIVQKEMYTFEDRGGRSITLRPEGTAPVVRAFLENAMINKGFPQRFFYIGPMFRYEKPQLGRMRQFHQFGFELIGSSSPLADVEIISMVNRFLKSLGLYKFKIVLNSIGCPKCRVNYRNALKNYYSEHYDELCDDCKRRYNTNILRLLDCKVDVELAEKAPKSVDYLCNECKEHYETVKRYLKIVNIDFEEDHKLVRGLDYYTRTVFEVRHELLGAQDSLGGGGRYDGLFEDMGGPQIPALGFASGIERIILAMKEEKVRVERENPHEVYFTVLGRKAYEKAFKLAEEIRNAGINVDMDVMERSLRGQLKHADRVSSYISLILGENELNKNIVIMRDMETGDQIEIDLDYVVEYVIDKVKKEH